MRILLDVGKPILCLLGSFLAAAGNSFVLNTPSKVAFNWFSKEHAGMVTFMGVLISMVSATIGAAVPSLIINEKSTPEDVRYFLGAEAIVVTVPMLTLVLLFREKPEQPPSKAA